MGPSPGVKESLKVLLEALGVSGEIADVRQIGHAQPLYRLTVAGQRCVLRWRQHGPAPGVSGHEAAALELLANVPHTPRLLAFDARLDATLLTWLEGRSPSADDFREPDWLAGLAIALRRVHSHALLAEPLDWEAQADDYFRVLVGSGRGTPTELIAERRAIRGLLRELRPRRDQQALCHHDLVPGNLLVGDLVGLIDWEYAGNDHPYFDLASVINQNGLDAWAEQWFVEAYFGQHSCAEIEALEGFKRIERYLSTLWCWATLGKPRP